MAMPSTWLRESTTLSIDEIGNVKLKNVDLPQAVYKINLTGNRKPNGESKSNPKKRRLIVGNPSPGLSDVLVHVLVQSFQEVEKSIINPMNRAKSGSYES
jgi:hypothetical protein